MLNIANVIFVKNVCLHIITCLSPIIIVLRVTRCIWIHKIIAYYQLIDKFQHTFDMKIQRKYLILYLMGDIW